MEVTKLKDLEPLLEARKKALGTLRKLDEVKEFTKLTLEGEDGGEHTSSVTFTWDADMGVPGRVRDLMRGIVETELKEVEAKIEAL